MNFLNIIHFYRTNNPNQLSSTSKATFQWSVPCLSWKKESVLNPKAEAKAGALMSLIKNSVSQSILNQLLHNIHFLTRLLKQITPKRHHQEYLVRRGSCTFHLRIRRETDQNGVKLIYFWWRLCDRRKGRVLWRIMIKQSRWNLLNC